MVLKRRKLGSLGQILIRLGKITPEQLKKTLSLQREQHPNKFLGELFVELQFITKEELYNILAFQFLYPCIDIQNYKLTESILHLVPKEIALKYKLVPLDKFSGILTLAMVNPLEKEAIDAVEKVTGLKVRVFVAALIDIEKILSLIYR